MTQLSPPVARAVAVLNFMAGHSAQAFTLTEIAKSLRLSSATCHSLLASLTEAGYVYRTVGKTYVLGPALARVAQASLAPALVMQVARPEMRLLADEFDVVCSAYRLRGDEVHIYERAAALSHVNWNASDSLTVAANAPVGGVFHAWKQEAEIAAWIAAAMPPLAPIAETALRESLRVMREREYGVGVRTLPLRTPKAARELQNRQEFTEDEIAAIAPRKHYQLAFVTAPVFARPGTVAFGLSLAGFVAPVPGKTIEVMAERLRVACDRIGEFIAGRKLF